MAQGVGRQGCGRLNRHGSETLQPDTVRHDYLYIETMF